jgi:hypothetical protein
MVISKSYNSSQKGTVRSFQGEVFYKTKLSRAGVGAAARAAIRICGSAEPETKEIFFGSTTLIKKPNDLTWKTWAK